MGFWDWLTGRAATPQPAPVPDVDPAPTQADIRPRWRGSTN